MESGGVEVIGGAERKQGPQYRLREVLGDNLEVLDCNNPICYL